jgi:uncharacterized membrane protein YoaK (UPF0700 family)
VTRPLVRLVADPEHGPLPALLLVLTAVAGVVDAASFLSLGQVFVANMTGNVVFVGLAIAGAPGFSLAASLFALGGFLGGAALGGPAADRLGADRAHVLRAAAGVEVVLVALALVVVALDGPDNAAVVVAALAMGVQGTTARRLEVFDLTTVVLTMTLTGAAAEIRQGDRFAVLRRLLAVGAMIAGAAIGAVLVLEVSTVAGLGLAVALLAGVALAAGLAARSPAPWHAPRA